MNLTRVASRAVLILVLLVAVAAADDLTGDQITLSVLYMFPVLIGTWAMGIWAGLVISFVSAALIAVVGFHSGHPFSHTVYFLINVASALLSFVLVTALVSRLRRSLDKERALARTDFLTGVANRAAFYHMLEREIARQQRYGKAFGLAYIDCDNFKAVNDSQGHHVGDEVLKAVGAGLGTAVRRTDFVARLGGDEFAVLLPETDALHAQAAVEAFQAVLLNTMAERGWPIGFSIGLANFARVPASADAALREADRLMYRVKAAGKGQILQQVF